MPRQDSLVGFGDLVFYIFVVYGSGAAVLVAGFESFTPL